MRLMMQYLPHYHIEKWGKIEYKHADDSGFDVRAAIETPMTLNPKEYALIPTGIIVALEKETTFEEACHAELQIRPRSGLAAKHGIGVVNAPGTVDFGYRGEIKVILINLGSEPFEIAPGDRIAQGVVTPVFRVNIVPVDEVASSTDRQAGGFGSTGRK